MTPGCSETPRIQPICLGIELRSYRTADTLQTPRTCGTHFLHTAQVSKCCASFRRASSLLMSTAMLFIRGTSQAVHEYLPACMHGCLYDDLHRESRCVCGQLPICTFRQYLGDTRFHNVGAVLLLRFAG